MVVNYGVGRRHGSDLALLWLWCRPVAAALIQPLAWEPPYAASAALKKQKKKKSQIMEFFGSLRACIHIGLKVLTIAFKTLPHLVPLTSLS